MKFLPVLTLLSLGSARRLVTLDTRGSPVSSVLTLIGHLKAEIEADGVKEQQSYDKFACWCEKTLARKTTDISDAKKLIEELQETILKMKGDLGAHGAEIKQLEKDIASNNEAQNEAKDVRNKELSAYVDEKTEAEQCIGALEAAIGVLSGAGTKNSGFLETMQEASLMSVAGGVKRVLERSTIAARTSESDMDVLRSFIEKPQDFSPKALSALQVGDGNGNPFGDYAPKSTQVTGIMKSMYDAFTSDLEKANAEESTKQKGFSELMASKVAELATLTSTLEKQQGYKGEKSKTLADSTTQRDDTSAQLKADEQFFEDTKGSCRNKAEQWAVRSRLRTEELQGIAQATKILSENSAVLDSSADTFVQTTAHKSAKRAYSKLRNLAAKYNNLALAQIAVEAKTEGHFDKVMVMIDSMIGVLRKEEQSDIEHRDRCEGAEKKNANDDEDADALITKHGNSIGRIGDAITAARTSIAGLKDKITATKGDLASRLTMRNREAAEFKQGLADDTQAVDIIKQAIVALSKFYKKNKIPMFLQEKKADADPEYTIDEDQAPKDVFEDENYGGKKGENGGIVGILSMIVEDTEKEIVTSTQDEADAEAEYDQDVAALRKTLRAQKDSKAQTEKELADLNGKKTDAEADKRSAEDDKAAAGTMKTTLTSDCDWVRDNFDTRATKRKNELQGLADAKNILAGADQGDYEQLTLAR